MAQEDFLQNTMKYYCLPEANTADIQVKTHTDYNSRLYYINKRKKYYQLQM